MSNDYYHPLIFITRPIKPIYRESRLNFNCAKPYLPYYAKFHSLESSTYTKGSVRHRNPEKYKRHQECLISIEKGTLEKSVQRCEETVAILLDFANYLVTESDHFARGCLGCNYCVHGIQSWKTWHDHHNQLHTKLVDYLWWNNNFTKPILQFDIHIDMYQPHKATQSSQKIHGAFVKTLSWKLCDHLRELYHFPKKSIKIKFS